MEITSFLVALLVVLVALLVLLTAGLLLAVVAVTRRPEDERPRVTVAATATATATEHCTATPTLLVEPPRDKSWMPAAPSKKKNKAMKCPKCFKITELANPIREVANGSAAHLVYACQKCGHEIQSAA